MYDGHRVRSPPRGLRRRARRRAGPRLGSERWLRRRADRLRARLTRMPRSRFATALLVRADRRYAEEVRGERVVFHRLRERGYLDGLAGKRILEIGPKHVAGDAK